MKVRRLSDVVRRGARLFGAKTAFKQDDAELTYRELAAVAEAGGEVLRGLGLAGSPVGLYAGHCLEYLCGYFGIVEAGGPVVPLAPAEPMDRTIAGAACCGLGCVVCHPRHAGALRAALAGTGVRALVVLEDRGRRPVAVPLAAASSPTSALGFPGAGRPSSGAAADAPAVLLATSGTDHRPKRVVLTHHNVLSNARAFLRVAALEPHDRALIALPLAASGTHTTEVLAYSLTGLTSVLFPFPVFLPGDYCRIIERERISVTNATPMILNALLAHGEEVASRVPSLRRVFFASAPMSGERLARLRRTFPHVEFFYGYGLTEASPRCTMLHPRFAHRKEGSAGRPLPGVELRIVDGDGRLRGPGQLGEIEVRGPNVMAGYHDRPEETAEVLKDGWLSTGDLGWLDEEGFLFVRGRKKNVVVTRGVNVSPEEVEEAILDHPGVAAALVAAEEDEIAGERIVAWVVRRRGGGGEEAEVTAGLLRRHLLRRLEPVKVPSRVRFVSELRTSPRQKLLRELPASAGQEGAPRDAFREMALHA